MHYSIIVALSLFASSPSFSQTISNGYDSLTPAKQHALQKAMRVYDLYTYSKENGRMVVAMAKDTGTVTALADVVLSCQTLVIENLADDRIPTSARAIALVKLGCMQQAFSERHLPYTTRFAKSN